MANTLTDGYSKKDLRLAGMLKALGHPARIAIVRILARHETCVCGEIVELLPLAQATVSQHLKALKVSGIIQGEVEGPRTCYCLDPRAIAEIDGLLESFLNKVSPGRCC